MLFGFVGLLFGALLTVITMGIGIGLLLVCIGIGAGGGLVFSLAKPAEFPGIDLHRPPRSEARTRKNYRLKEAAQLLEAKPKSISTELAPSLVFFLSCLGFAAYTRIDSLFANLLCISLVGGIGSEGIAS